MPELPPPVELPVDLGPAARPLRLDRRPAVHRALAVASALLVVAGGLAVALKQRPGHPLDARRALAAAQDAVRDDPPYRFELHEERRLAPERGEPLELDARYDLEGALASSRLWSVTGTTQYGSDEDPVPLDLVRDGDLFYVTDRDEVDDDLADARWFPIPVSEAHSSSADEADGDFDPGHELDVLLDASLLGNPDDPIALRHILLQADRAGDAEALDGGGLRLHAVLEPDPDAERKAGEDLPALPITIDLDAADHPTRIAFTAVVPGGREVDELLIAGLGTDVQVHRPDEAQIERTPWIDEQGLADLDPAMLLAPASPPGTELVFAYAIDLGDDSGCTGLGISFADLADDDPADYADDDRSDWSNELSTFDVAVRPKACLDSFEYDGSADDPFDQTLGGRPARGLDEDTDSPEVLVGDVIVAMDDHLGDIDVDLDAVVRSLAPTTPDALAARIPDAVQDITLYDFDG